MPRRFYITESFVSEENCKEKTYLLTTQVLSCFLTDERTFKSIRMSFLSSSRVHL